ncbi:MAG TPA: hypothetical protein PLD47_01160 [Aggregatilineales bacterium]|nr:hypothetical protein [Anaerolineales bacterium]HRE46307.1 hypothetical protein [Aggregatilineales bacterium]
MSDSQRSLIETEIAPGLTSKWVQDGSLLLITFQTITRQNNAAWIAFMEETLRHWDEGRPFSYILRAEEISLTGMSSYIRESAKTVAKYAAAFPGGVAIVLRHSLLSDAVGLFLRMLPSGKRQRRLFTSVEDALAWLETLEKAPLATPPR